MLRLVRIEARRNVGPWFVPVMVALSLLYAYGQGLTWRSLFWVDASVMVRDSVLIIGPFLAGAAAWMGSRERRRALDDLFITMHRPRWSQQMAVWTATTVWGLLAYVATGAYLVIQTVLHAVWGVPVLWPMLVGLVAIPTYAAIGYVLGSYLPSRITAPFVASVLFMLQVVVGWGGGSGALPMQTLRYLSPVAFLDTSVWYGVRPNVGLAEILFFLGLTALSLSSLVLRERKDRPAWSPLLGGFVLGTAGVAILLITDPQSALALQSTRQSGAPNSSSGTLIPYTYACSGTVPVCVHPAYQPWLRGDAAVVNALVAPLRGIPSAPTRAEQRPHSEQGVFDRVLTFIPAAVANDLLFYGPVALTLVQDSAYNSQGPLPQRCPSDTTLQSCFEAQDALGIWLVRRAGLRLDPIEVDGAWIRPYFGGFWSITSRAANRFAALRSERQHVWLRAHYLALRQGKVRLGDLP